MREPTPDVYGTRLGAQMQQKRKWKSRRLKFSPPAYWWPQLCPPAPPPRAPETDGKPVLNSSIRFVVTAVNKAGTGTGTESPVGI